ncbi:glycosyltransferase family 2 protein [Paenibacillus flagellatus]|uniref:Glycosyl transferase family 2 n=1 Tax=Paenibacillus flagellatus TaxID=2211139 RepID=A0A2V5JZD2_9BACL|nr:glycosyltransferase [Paenibacillus flagellatus]PYI52101.1 glycosyl transferase family 2 [Paenibacillus flagellatus]
MPKLRNDRKRRASIEGAHRSVRSPEEPVVSVIIPVFNERKTIVPVLRNAARVHPQTEVIVVANGTTDGTCRIAERMGARVIRYPERLGHDVGRSIGARYARGAVLLFTDGDIVVPASDMRALADAVGRGVDVALNSYSGPTRQRENVHGVVLAKHALNAALSRPDLRGASLTTIPHAISRSALSAIGVESLAVPPMAQAIAVRKGLRVEAVRLIDVGRKNPLRRRRSQGKDPLESLIVGDHYEALHWLAASEGERGGLPDLGRMRETVR